MPSDYVTTSSFWRSSVTLRVTHKQNESGRKTKLHRLWNRCSQGKQLLTCHRHGQQRTRSRLQRSRHILIDRKDKKQNKQSSSSAYKLYAANNTPIRTYGVKTLNLEQRRYFRWTFIVAAMKTKFREPTFYVIITFYSTYIKENSSTASEH